MREASNASLRLREIVLRAAAPLSEKYQDISTPVVVEAVMKDWKSLKSDDEVLVMLVRDGLARVVRNIVKELIDADGTEEGGSRAQLDLFPNAEREIVQRIAIGRIFVPSRQALVCYHDRKKISEDELVEAGEYLIEHGRGAISRGEAIIELANLRAGARRRPPSK